MKIWKLEMKASEGYWENSVITELYKDYVIAKKHLDNHRNDFKKQFWTNENGDEIPILKFSEDKTDSFICTDGKWTYDYGIFEQEVLES